MRKDKTQAIKLRKQGLSYNEINGRLKIPKSTLSYWLSSIKISQKASERISARVHKGSIAGLLKRNKNQTILAQKRAIEIRRLAKIEVSGLLKNKLFLTGTSLYWAEGYKKGAEGSKWKCVDFTNSNSEMIEVMMRFFREICEVKEDNFRMQLIAHPNMNINKATVYWSKLTGVPKNRFIKTSTALSKSSKRKRGNTLTNGTLHVRINNVKLFFRIIGWIDGLKHYMLP